MQNDYNNTNIAVRHFSPYKGNRKIPTSEAPDTVLVTTPSSLSNLAERGTLSMTTIMSTTVQSTPASLTLFHADDVKSWSQGVTPAMSNSFFVDIIAF